MGYFVSGTLLVAAVIHLLPVSGVLGADQLARLYGVSVSEPNLAIVMRHRAILFGLIGVLLAVAAFVPSMQLLAFIAGLVSVGSFLLIAWDVGGYNAQIGRVVMVDVVAAVCLLAGLAGYLWAR